MDYFNKQNRYMFIGAGMLVIVLALVMTAMFSDESPVRGVSSLAHKYIYPAKDGLNVGLSQGIRLLLLGVFSGIVGGMMGMGGGVVKTSGLLLVFGVDILLVRTVALITNVFIYGSATYRNAKKEGLILRKVVELMIPGALIGVVLGFIIGNVIYSIWLQRLLGLFAMVSGLLMLRKLYFSKPLKIFKMPDTGNDEVFEKGKIACAGLPMGFVMGLFGISGGVVGVPFQRFLLKIPFKNAIANSSVTSLVASTVAMVCALWYEYAYGQYGLSTPIIIALWIIPGNIFGAQLGAYLTGILPLRFIKLLYVIIMLIIGVGLFF
ncbi:MAG: sulfite exporter TauE/SafE family protein [Candidatus Anammoxibacter sp.]